ncbi:hypothetical protein TFUB22_00987 [Tannerella forsythia]|nr:hypothetical protein TFUB22_00987 [Tannerella forsythia]
MYHFFNITPSHKGISLFFMFVLIPVTNYKMYAIIKMVPK